MLISESVGTAIYDCNVTLRVALQDLELATPRATTTRLFNMCLNVVVGGADGGDDLLDVALDTSNSCSLVDSCSVLGFRARTVVRTRRVMAGLQ